MSESIDLVLASPLNTVIFLAVLAIVGKLLAEGLFVAAGGLLLPLGFLLYLEYTDAMLVR
ncbi:hypothetical protein [Halobaculum sp. EA56]|uniref:hypothetical protein n=1 Tax=Halobaculum sp. EA56 TaxID=3421648 RepID=UPI003EC076F1